MANLVRNKSDARTKELTVDMGRAALVATRQHGVKDGQPVGIGGLHAAESPELEDRRVIRVAHARVALDASIDTLQESATPQQSSRSSYRRVGAPDIDIGVGNHLAGLVVDDLDGQSHFDTGHTLGEVLADLLATDVWKGSASASSSFMQPHTQRPLVNVGHEDAGASILEQGRGIHVLRDGLVGLVVDPRHGEVVSRAERAPVNVSIFQTV